MAGRMAPSGNRSVKDGGIPFRNRLQVRLVGGFLLLAFIPVVLVGFFAYQRAKDGFEKQVAHATASIGHQVTSRVSTAIDVADSQLAIWTTQYDTRNVPRVYGQTFVIYQHLQKRFRSFLKSQQDVLPIFHHILAVKPSVRAEEARRAKEAQEALDAQEAQAGDATGGSGDAADDDDSSSGAQVLKALAEATLPTKMGTQAGGAAQPEKPEPTVSAALVLFADEESLESKEIYPTMWRSSEEGFELDERYEWGSAAKLGERLGGSPFDGEKQVIAIARDYLDVDEEQVALVGLLAWSEIERLVGETSVGADTLETLAQHNDTYVVLTDDDGNVLGGTAPAGSMNREIAAALLADLKEGQATGRKDIDGIGDAIIALETNAAVGLNVLTFKNATLAMAPIVQLRNANVAAGFIVLVMIFALGIYLSGRLTAPVQRLVEATHLAAAGNLDHSIAVSTNDEIGQLAGSFNVMIGRLRQSFSLLEEQNEELRRLDKLKDEFLANTSHELRTPIHGVIGLLNGVLDGAYGPVEDRVRGILEMTVTSGRRLATLVNSILDFSAAKKNEETLNVSEVDVRRLVERELYPIWAGFNQPKGLALAVEVDDDLPSIDADEEKLRQVLMNLMSNAIKFTKQGNVTLRMTTLREGDTPLGIHLEVEDTGIGMPKEDLNAIFEPFRQLEGGAAREFSGTGLGLAIVKGHVERHGGRIVVESELGKGSRFFIDLPLKAGETVEFDRLAKAAPTRVEMSADLNVAPSSEPSSTTPVEPSRPPPSREAAKAEAPPVGSKASTSLEQPSWKVHAAKDLSNVRKGNGELVWVVDDEPVNIEIIRAQLEMANYSCRSFLSAVEALEALEDDAELPGVCLLDLMMPKMTGYEFCAHLKADPRFAPIPVVMLSAKNQLVDKIYGLNVGAIDYLTKPFERDELLTKIRVFLDLRIGQRMREELEVASAVQGMLVPASPFEGPNIELSTRLEACTEIGGDWVSIMHRPDNAATAAIVADVSGHGAPAALVTALIHGYFAAVQDQLWAKDGNDWFEAVSACLSRLSRSILDSTGGKLTATLSLLCFDHVSKKARWLSAGHPSPLIVTPKNGKNTVAALGLPPSHLLGVPDVPLFSWCEQQLHSGQVFMLYSDGILEGTNKSRRMYGQKRLSRVLSQVNGESPSEVIERVLTDFRGFIGGTETDDDVTLVVGRVR